MTTPVTVAYGDGSGPEITEAVLYILREAAADITIETIEIGERIYNMDEKTGILPSSWDSLLRTRILLAAPAALREGFKDPAEVIRESFELTDSHKKIHSQPGMEAHSYVSEIFALFVPAHGAMNELAGKNKANPSSMLLAACAMLEHIGQSDKAEKIKHAWLKTIEDGMVTADLHKWGSGTKKLGTQEFAEEIANRLGKISFGYISAGV